MALVLAAALSSLALPSAPAAASEDVSTAAQRVARLQSLVVSTAAELTRGTRAWEADRAALRRTQARLALTRVRLARTQQVVDRATAHVDALARRMYMHPVVASGLQMAITRTPEGVLDSIRTQDAVDHVAGTDGEVIRDAQQARMTLRRHQSQVEAQAAEARGLERRSAKKLAELQALAARTGARLAAAEAALTGARSRQAARARAARLRAMLALRSGPACTVQSNAGRQNGNLDPASLCPLWMAPRHRLRFDAAQAFNRMNRFHRATTGRFLCVTDSYRSYSEQVDVYRRKPQLAAVPGTSRHGWGIALDLCGGVQRFGTPAYRWMKAHGPRFGWAHPAWAEPSGSMPEPWHWEYVR